MACFFQPSKVFLDGSTFRSSWRKNSCSLFLSSNRESPSANEQLQKRRSYTNVYRQVHEEVEKGKSAWKMFFVVHTPNEVPHVQHCLIWIKLLLHGMRGGKWETVREQESISIHLSSLLTVTGGRGGNISLTVTQANLTHFPTWWKRRESGKTKETRFMHFPCRSIFPALNMPTKVRLVRREKIPLSSCHVPRVIERNRDFFPLVSLLITV